MPLRLAPCASGARRLPHRPHRGPDHAAPGLAKGVRPLLADCAAALDGVADPDLTVELITHRFTQGSKRVLERWYPGSRLEMDEGSRTRKTTKFGSVKWVFGRDTMKELRAAFKSAIGWRLPAARILYWT